jgi:hypothetical protein
MDSRNISQNALVRMAGRVRCIQYRRVPSRNLRCVRSQPSGASSNTHLSRRVCDNSSQAWIRLRRTNTRLILSSLSGLDRKQTGDPALKRWTIFFRACRCWSAELFSSRTSRDNSPPFQRWVFARQTASSPIRTKEISLYRSGADFVTPISKCA